MLPAPRQSGHNQARANEKLRAFHEEDALGKAYDTRLMSRLWPFVKPARALAIRVARDARAGGGRRHRAAAGDGRRGPAGRLRRRARMLRDVLVFTGLIVAVQSMNFAQMYTMQIAGARAMADLRAHVFLFLQRLQLRYFDRTPVGRLVTRATNDVDALGELFASGGSTRWGTCSRSAASS